MSYTEIFAFGKDGNAYEYGEVRNAHRGAMAVWRILEKKYLPDYRPSYVPAHIPDDMVESFLRYKPSRLTSMFDDKAMKEVWDLYKDDRLSDNEKIVLASTFDYVVVKKEDFEKLITAFKEFEGETSLKEQAVIITKMLEDEDVIAVGWNQTSVNGDTWSNLGGFDEENEEYIPYNLFTGEKHWFMIGETE